MGIKGNLEFFSEEISPGSAGNVFIHEAIGEPHPEQTVFNDGSVLEDWQPWDWDIWARLGRGSAVPVGQKNVTVAGTGGWLPELVPGTATETLPEISPAIDRRDEPPLDERQPMSQLPATFPWISQGNGRWTYYWPDGTITTSLSEEGVRTIAREQGIPSPLGEEDDVTIFEDIWDVIDENVGGVLPGGTPPFWEQPPGYSPPPRIPPPTNFPAPAPAPMPPGAPPMQNQQCGPWPVQKRVCGVYKWVYPKRRRRKQLVTRSDIKGLAALKGVLGAGKAMETWIATHS